ncbi:MAG TPA: glycosyl hydrolase family 28-related protein [Trebonia sp.]|jgi:hypothetical protein|nr:glycosyl hydrolase family 28-related protein [Trebonia sp.]
MAYAILSGDPRAPGTVNPAGDANNINDVVAGMPGGLLNVLNIAYGGGAKGDGSTDDTTAINDALGAASPGQGVFFPDGRTFRTSAPLTPPPGVILVLGFQGYDPEVWGDSDSGPVIAPLDTFSGSAIIQFSDVGHAVTQGPSILGGALDGTDLPGTTDGIRGTGPVNASAIKDIVIANVTGVGINCVTDSGASGQTYPYGWWVEHVKIDGAGEQGMITPNNSDSTWIGVYVLGNGAHTSGHGWSISGPMPNSRAIGCRMEWAGTGKDGYHLSGAWGSGTGSGGMTFIGCSSDRNDANGFGCTATGNVPVSIVGGMFRRDGRNGGSGGGSFAGINLNGSTIPVTIDPFTVYPGVDDDGTQTNSPEYGLSISNSAANITIGRGYVQGAAAPIHNDNSCTNVSIDYNGLLRASGTTTSPSYDTSAIWAAATPPVTVQNTATETTLVTLTLPPGVLQAGSTYRINVMGTVQVQATSGTLTFKPYVGGTAAAQTPQMLTQGSSAGPVSFWLEMYVAVQTAGASGTYAAHGRGEIEFTSRVNLHTDSTTTTAVDTQTATTVKLTAEWATASTTNILTIVAATIERVGNS